MRLLFNASLAVAVLLTTVVRADDYKSPDGYTITYPEGWKLAKREELDQFNKATARLNGPAMSMLVRGELRDKFADNINLIIIPVPQPLTLGGNEERDFVAHVRQTLPRATNFSTKHIEINGATALSMAYDNEQPGVSGTMRVWQLYFPGKTKLYVFNCTTLKPRWKEVWPLFKAAMHSVKIDVPAGK
jgi:hypothetical protein